MLDPLVGSEQKRIGVNMSALSEHYAGKECPGDSTQMKSTPAMCQRIRELMTDPRDDYDRAVECVVDDLERLVREIKFTIASTSDPIAKQRLTEVLR